MLLLHGVLNTNQRDKHAVTVNGYTGVEVITVHTMIGC